MQPSNDTRSTPSILEGFLILIALLILILVSIAYWVDYPIHRILLGKSLSGELVEIGKLESHNGSVKRKTTSDGTFSKIDSGANLYNMDTIVTGPDSSGVITLSDGTQLELAPKTMIILAFESHFTLTGISRSTQVNVVTGEILNKKVIPTVQIKNLAPPTPKPVVVLPKPKVEPAPPPPPPPPPKPELSITDFYPPPGAVFRVADWSTIAQRKIDFRWKSSLNSTKTRFLLKRTLPTEQVALDETIESKNFRSRAGVTLKSPGTYEWMILVHESNSESVTMPKPFRSTFVLDPEFKAIKIKDPLVAGKRFTSSRLESDRTVKEFDITLKWQPYPTGERYEVLFYRKLGDLNPTRFVAQSNQEFLVNKNNVFSGSVSYKVQTKLPSGFIASSDLASFRFDFLPPILVYPQSNQSLLMKDITEDDGKIIFTWQKTNFTKAYFFEISEDEGFTKIKTKKISSDNFYIWKSPGPGTYHWRVRSVASKSLQSPPSEIFKLVISP